jgi:hypothetical protein
MKYSVVKEELDSYMYSDYDYHLDKLVYDRKFVIELACDFCRNQLVRRMNMYNNYFLDEDDIYYLLTKYKNSKKIKRVKDIMKSTIRKKREESKKKRRKEFMDKYGYLPSDVSDYDSNSDSDESEEEGEDSSNVTWLVDFDNTEDILFSMMNKCDFLEDYPELL